MTKDELVTIIRDHKNKDWEGRVDEFELADSILAAGASECADAEKDAALTDEQIRDIWLRETGFDEQAAPFAILEFARAILAADKERAEPRALTDERAKEIAQQVHAECSRIPGATFYNAAMSAIEQAVKERK
jgi:hypothetical protein